MARVQNMWSSHTPSVATSDDRLYVVVKKPDQEGIRLAWTERPQDGNQWVSIDVNTHFSDPPGPSQIRTSDSPGMSAFGSRIRIGFKGHNNLRIWLLSMTHDDSQLVWSPGGYLQDGVETTSGPALLGSRVIYRAAGQEGRILVRHTHIPGRGREIPGAMTDDTPSTAIVTLGGRSAVAVAWHDPRGNNILWSVNGRRGWMQAQVIPGAISLHSPGLCTHDGRLYLAYRGLDGSVWLGNLFHGVYWNILGAFSFPYTTGVPVLSSFADQLYVFGKGDASPDIWYRDVPFQEIGTAISSVASLEDDSHDVELGNAIYNQGRSSNFHGHAGLWLGIWGSRSGNVANGILRPALSRRASDQGRGMPIAEGFSGFIEHGKDSSGSSHAGTLSDGETSISGIDDLKSISWAEAYRDNPQGELSTLAQVFFADWVQHAMDSFKEKNYMGTRAPRPHAIRGQDRRRAVNAAYRVFLRRPGYCMFDMLKSVDRVWQRRIEDIKELRCDGLIEVAWEHAGQEVTAGNLFGPGDPNDLLDAHNKLHTHFPMGYVSGDICPIIQGYLEGALGHTSEQIGDDISWRELTSMRETPRSNPFIYGSVGVSEIGDCLEIMVGLADYGSDVIYCTLAGVYHREILELIVEGDYDSTDFDVSNMWFFREVHLADAFNGRRIPPSEQVSAGLQNGYVNHGIIRVRWHGATIGNGDKHVRYVRRFSDFEILLVDASGNYQVYRIDNPHYGAV